MFELHTAPLGTVLPTTATEPLSDAWQPLGTIERFESHPIDNPDPWIGVGLQLDRIREQITVLMVDVTVNVATWQMLFGAAERRRRRAANGRRNRLRRKRTARARAHRR